MPKNHQLRLPRDRVLSAFPQFAHMDVQEFRRHASEVTRGFSPESVKDLVLRCLSAKYACVVDDCIERTNLFQAPRHGVIAGDIEHM
jgi:hypothetical protein